MTYETAYEEQCRTEQEQVAVPQCFTMMIAIVIADQDGDDDMIENAWE